MERNITVYIALEEEFVGVLLHGPINDDNVKITLTHKDLHSHRSDTCLYSPSYG